MAKGSLFVGSGSGKVGNLVLANTKSGQVTRVYQPNVKNPKTKAQMLQRARFADAVKFYKQATNGFFYFAYEDKTKVESDYNAFMRHNIMNAIPLARPFYESPKYPALGRLFQLSSGRLNTTAVDALIANTAGDTGSGGWKLRITLPAAPTAATIGALSSQFVAAGASEGDIVTIMFEDWDISNTDWDLAKVDDITANAPRFTVAQFIIDSTSTDALSSIKTLGSHSVSDGFEFELVDGEKCVQTKSAFGVGAASGLVITRKTDDGLLATNSYLGYDDTTTEVLESLETDTVIAQALQTWKSSGGVILKGAIADGSL